MTEPSASDFEPAYGYIYQALWTAVHQMKACRFSDTFPNDFFVVDFCPGIICAAKPFDAMVPDHQLRVTVQKIMNRDPKIDTTKIDNNGPHYVTQDRT